MQDKSIRISLESIIFILIALLGISIRLSRLDWPPASYQEATNALNAAASSGQGSVFWPEDIAITIENPISHLFASTLFSLAGSSISGARVLSMIAGVVLISLPFLFRETLGKGVAVVASFLIAISPILMKISRQVGGPVVAVLSLAFAFLILARRANGKGTDKDPYLLGVSLGLGFTAGPSFYQGVFGISLALILIWIWRARVLKLTSGGIGLLPAHAVLPSFVLTVFLIGSGFGFMPSNLRGIFDGLGVWAVGWRGGGLASMTLLFILLVYEPLVLFTGSFRATSPLFRDRQIETWMLAWSLGSLIAALLYPNRQAESLVWVVVPLILLTGFAVSGILDKVASWGNGWMTLVFSAGFLVLFAFAYLQLSSFASLVAGVTSGSDLITHLGASISGLVLAVIATVLISYGWSWEIAWSSLRMAAIVGLLALTISAGWNLNFGESSAGAGELWNPHGTTKVVDILEDILKNLSEAATGRDDAMQVEVYGEAHPLIAWALRDFPESDALPPDVFLIPDSQAQPVFPIEYRGQVLTLMETRGWAGSLPPDLIRWWVRREMPVSAENWILFVRQDLAGLHEIDPVIDE